jgi:hypothetical protein
MSAEQRQERSNSLKIDRELEEAGKQLRRECKILLLGNNELVDIYFQGDQVE